MDAQVGTLLSGNCPPLQIRRSLNQRAGRPYRSTRSLTMATLTLAMPPCGMMAWPWKGLTLIPRMGESLCTPPSFCRK